MDIYSADVSIVTTEILESVVAFSWPGSGAATVEIYRNWKYQHHIPPNRDELRMRIDVVPLEPHK